MAMAVRDSQSYIIKGGKEGRARLAVISRVLAPSTQSLLDPFEPLSDFTVIDAGCAGGHVSFELAQRVGANGRVVGIDFDESKLVLAREEAAARGIGNIEFHNANILDPWPADGAALIHVRFVLTHLADPERLLENGRRSCQAARSLLRTSTTAVSSAIHPARLLTAMPSSMSKRPVGAAPILSSGAGLSASLKASGSRMSTQHWRSHTADKGTSSRFRRLLSRQSLTH